MAFAKQQHDSEEVSKELEKLRLENSRLKNELERCQRTVHDNDSTKWILVNHDLWIVQQEHLKNFDCNRWRYDIAIVMVAFSLLLVSGK